MDPKNLADEIINDIFNQHAEEAEIQEEEDEFAPEDELEDEDELEEDSEGEEEDEDDFELEEDETEASHTLDMKGGSDADPEVNGKPKKKSSKEVFAANGASDQDATGKGTSLGTHENPAADPEKNKASLDMKPSFASPQLPTLTREQLEKDVRTMFGGNTELSEEFVDQAVGLYSAAVTSKVKEYQGALTKTLSEAFERKMLEVHSDLTQQLNGFLNYVVEEWLQQNEVAVENSLRTEIAEDLLRSIKSAFIEHDVAIPEGKEDAFDELATQVEHLEARLNEEMQTNVSLIESYNSLESQLIFEQETKALTTNDREKVQKLVENLEFVDADDFRNKVKNLVSGASKSKPTDSKKLTEEAGNKGGTQDASPAQIVLEEGLTDEELAEKKKLELEAAKKAGTDPRDRILNTGRALANSPTGPFSNRR